MALGLLLLANSRPFEGALISLPICCYTLWILLRERTKAGVWLPGMAVLFAGAAVHRILLSSRYRDISPFHGQPIGGNGVFARPLCLANRMTPFITSSPISLFTTGTMRRCRTWEQRRRLAFLRKWSVKAIYQWLFFVFPALSLALIGLIPTLRARRFRVLMYTLAFACCGFVSETWLQAHYVAVASGIVYLILLNGLRWMRVSARHHVVWLKLLRGTLASIVCMFFVRLLVVPGNTFPPNWASQTADIPGFRDITRIMEAKPGKQLVIVRYRPDHFWGYSWINNGYDIPTEHVIWARDTEPLESNVPLGMRVRGS